MKPVVTGVREPALDGQEVELLLRRLEEYRVVNELNKKQLAAKLRVPYGTFKTWFFARGKANKPSKKGIASINAFLEAKEAEHRADIMRGLLLAVEDQLRWFKDIARITGRETFRRSLNSYDMGYVASLLTMLTDEEKFKRWLEFNTYRFQEFKSR